MNISHINFDFLEKKNIAIFICGSISIYKTCEIIRLFKKSNFNIKVVMSKNARKFIKPIVFEALSGNEVLYEKNEKWSNKNNHIDIGKWADMFLIAPITANTINKIAHGIADDFFTSSILAFNKKIIIAPSANENMLNNPITINNIKKLKELSFEIIEPIEKKLICGDISTGALANIEDIFLKSLRALYSKKYFINRDIIILGGASIEKIDDVRYISNFSSGKMAYYLSVMAYIYGANVNLISSSFTNKLFSSYSYTSSSKLLEILNSLPLSKNKKPFFFSVSAICDYIPNYTKGKLKKKDLGDVWNLSLNKNKDILNLFKFDGYKIGFKAETNIQESTNNAKNMLKNKNLDGVCLNIVDDKVFGGEENAISFYTKDKDIIFNKAHKIFLSHKILNSLKDIFL
jgi:phosphopantothenoylcysteine decarboxylase/phosphopantothenate--cysteine ligase